MPFDPDLEFFAVKLLRAAYLLVLGRKILSDRDGVQAAVAQLPVQADGAFVPGGSLDVDGFGIIPDDPLGQRNGPAADAPVLVLGQYKNILQPVNFTAPAAQVDKSHSFFTAADQEKPMPGGSPAGKILPGIFLRGHLAIMGKPELADQLHGSVPFPGKGAQRHAFQQTQLCHGGPDGGKSLPGIADIPDGGLHGAEAGPVPVENGGDDPVTDEPDPVFLQDLHSGLADRGRVDGPYSQEYVQEGCGFADHLVRGAETGPLSGVQKLHQRADTSGSAGFDFCSAA